VVRDLARKHPGLLEDRTAVPLEGSPDSPLKVAALA